MGKERIQKILAAAGFGSRRACEQLVVDGRVTVNGRLLRDLPELADAGADRITVDGRPIRTEQRVYYMLNKPSGVLCTHNDPAGRTRAVDLMTGVRERLFPVGRLDADASGLLIMTNDGALAQTLSHPRYGAPKTYRAEVAGMPSLATLEKLRGGVWLAEGKTAPAMVKVIHRQRDRAVLEITIREARNREIRRMLAKCGHNVRRLTRIRIGKLSVARLPLGAHRRLTDAEVAHLRALSERTAPPARHGHSNPKRPSGRRGGRQPRR